MLITTFINNCGPEKGRLVQVGNLESNLLRAGVLGNCLGTLRNGVLGQLSGKQKPDGCLDLPGGDGRPLVIVGQAGRL